MLHAFLLKGSFYDSVSLMLVSKKLSSAPHVNRVSVMMGTPANLTLLKETGFQHPLLAEATPNDICVVIDAPETEKSEEELLSLVKDDLTRALTELSHQRSHHAYPVVHSWRRADKALPEANIALVSVPGAYATQVALEALHAGKNVMLFSDHVSIADEVTLKTIAAEKDLLVMGPDCGTAIIHGAPLAFANRVPSGPVGIVGASGTGIQEVTSQLARRGIGISHAIGLGGRDLQAEVGARSALRALTMLNADPHTKVILFVSKPPAPEMREKVTEALLSLHKPAVTLFLGQTPATRWERNLLFAYTLDEAAQLAADLAHAMVAAEALPRVTPTLEGLFTGGTIASEVAMLLKTALGNALPDTGAHENGVKLSMPGIRVIDLGDDAYTQGRPHPMIDPSVRTDVIAQLSDDTGLLLLDVVLGWGSAENPAGAVAFAINALRAKRTRPLIVLATLTGTEADPQVLSVQKAVLEAAGILVLDSVREMVYGALAILARAVHGDQPTQTPVPTLLTTPPAVINIGLERFAEDLHRQQIPVVQYRWAPSCGGDEHLQSLLSHMK